MARMGPFVVQFQRFMTHNRRCVPLTRHNWKLETDDEKVPFNLHVPYVCECGNGHTFLLRNPTMPKESVTLVAVRESSGWRPAILMFRELIGLVEGSDDL